MKKVIEGKLYNTDTARLIGEWSNNLGGRELSFLSESLYRTKSGAYFIHGEGGPNTKYGQSVGNNSWSGGEKILPMSPASARKWAEEKLTAEEYIEVFGEPEEASDTKEDLKIYISAELKRRLELMREETRKSISQIIEDKFAE